MKLIIITLTKIVCFLQIDMMSVGTGSISLDQSIGQLFKKWLSKWEVNSSNLVSIFHVLYWRLAISLQRIPLCNSQSIFAIWPLVIFNYLLDICAWISYKHFKLCTQTELLIFSPKLVLLPYSLAQLQASTFYPFP